jgi:hypothetical protein
MYTEQKRMRLYKHILSNNDQTDRILHDDAWPNYITDNIGNEFVGLWIYICLWRFF